ncbi:MAG: Rgp1-domain-containing protein [Podila humilis]|nr:MAG: Rgp1-domain-containing protein [Podila humilis]
MPISVKATFAQEGVFFAGERLNCTITFTNSGSPASSNGAANGQGTHPARPSSTLQQKLLHHHQEQQQLQQQQLHQQNQHHQQHEVNGANGKNQHRDKTNAASPTSPSSISPVTSPLNSPLNAEARTQARSGASQVQNVGTPNVANENGNRPRRPSHEPLRTLSQARLSSDISHIDAMPRESDTNKGRASVDQDDQTDQDDDTASVIVTLPRNDEDNASQPLSSPTRQHPQGVSGQEEAQQASSPGLLGLATFVYRSASFSSLANAFGLSGGEPEPEPERLYDQKKLPPLPPPDHEGKVRPRTVLPPEKIMSPDNEEERTTHESLSGSMTNGNHPESSEDPEELARMGTPIGGVGLSVSSGSKATDSGTSGLSERMIELQVTDSADTQSQVDESDMYQTPRPSMDVYSTRSSMQSVRGPFQHQFYQERPTRRSSMMSNYSTSPGPRGTQSQGSKKESLLWGSVQVVGQFMVDGSFIRQQGFESLKSKTMYRPAGSSGGGAMGGGTLGAVNSDWRERANTNRLFPVFSTPPSILFVDLQLAPGESTSYTYQIDIPSDLPPSHRGKTIRFSYNLVLGVQRGSVHTPAKNIQLPFRLYNNISEQGTRPVYDLMSPVILHKDTSISGLAGQRGSRSLDKPNDNPKMARKQFEDYVDELVRNIKPNSEDFSPTHTRELTRRESDAYKDEEMIHSQSCLEKVAMLSRSASAASYDICKNNVPVAKLSLLKTRFKLGETVHGVISFTTREIPTYQISITLETVEAIEPNYACRSAAQTAKLTKRVHAELHESCIDTMRTSFALCIPPTATPEFKTSTLTLKWYVRVEFITGPANQPRFKMTTVDERRSQYQAVESLTTESFDCSVPIQVYPTSYETGALFPPTMSVSLA